MRFEKGNTWSKGIKQSDEAKALRSEKMKGNTYRLGHKHNQESKDKISESVKEAYKNGKPRAKMVGEKNGFWGMKHSEESKQKIAQYRIGKTTSDETKLKISGPNNHGWRGGTSFEPYCLKFNKRFKESVRDWFNHECFLCGITELEQMEDQVKRNKRPYRLSIHHVSYNKNCLCDNIDCEFIPLCSSCHSKTTNGDRAYWETHIIELLTKRRKLNER